MGPSRQHRLNRDPWAAIEKAGGSITLIEKKVLEADEVKRKKTAAKKAAAAKKAGGGAAKEATEE